MNGEISQLGERIAKLERKSSFQQQVIAVLAGIILVVALSGLREATPDMIEAKRFVLRDYSGRIRSAWGSGISADTGRPRLEFYSEFNDTTIVLGYEGAFNRPKLTISEPLLSDAAREQRGKLAEFERVAQLDPLGFSAGGHWGESRDEGKNTSMVYLRNNSLGIGTVDEGLFFTINDNNQAKFLINGNNPSVSVRRQGKEIWTAEKKK